MDNTVLLKFKFGDSNTTSLASASLIKYKKQYVVATAAHCLYDLSTKEAAHSIQIVIPKGKVKEVYDVSTVIIPKEWIELSLLTYDYAFARVKLSDDKTYNALAPYFNAGKIIKNHTEDMTFAGFPISIFQQKKRFSTGNLDFTLYDSENLIGMKSKLKSGISGGPWYLSVHNQKVQVGVTSAKIKAYKNMVWAPLWTPDAELLLEQLLTSKSSEQLLLR